MPLFNPPSDANLQTSDITTNDVSTTKHGFAPKGTNVGAFLKDDGTWAVPSGAGDVAGPSSSVDNAITRYNGTTGKVIQGYTSGDPTISDTGDITAPGDLTVGTGVTTSFPTKLTVYQSSTALASFINTAASSSGAGAGMIGVQDDGAAISSGHRLGYFLLGAAYDASSNTFNSSGIIAFATEDWNSTNRGGDLRFQTTPNTTITRTTRMTIGQDGAVSINAITPANGLLTVGTNTTADTGGIYFGTDTNLYRSAANTLKTDDTLIIGTPGTAAGSAATIDGTQTFTNKTLTSPTINTPTGIVKGDVGLGNVDNTSDATKDAATATLTNKTFDSTSPTAFNPAGIIQPYGGRSAPTGWLMCDGSAVSRSTYSGLFAAICEAVGTFTVTIASPAVVSLTAHGLVTGDSVYLTTTGALPTGLSANTLYYAIKVDANSFNLATTRANAVAGTKINTSGTQSGTHTLRWCPYGLGDGSTTFTLPDLRGRVPAGADAMGGTAASRLTLADALGSYGNIGASGGEQRHTMTTAELVSHTHSSSGGAAVVGNGANGSVQTGGSLVTPTGNNSLSSTGSTTPFNMVQPTVVANYIIKT